MPRPDLAKRIECDSSLSRIVIYGHAAAHHDAELIEQGIKETFDWIKSVWVDCDAYHHVTINLDVTGAFQKQKAIRQYELFYELIMHVVQSVGWDASRTVLVHNGKTYRLNP